MKNRNDVKKTEPISLEEKRREKRIKRLERAIGDGSPMHAIGPRLIKEAAEKIEKQRRANKK